MTDLIPIPVEAVATHRKLRWHQILVQNMEDASASCLVAQASTVPVRLDGEEVIRVPGPAEPAGDRQVVVRFDQADPRHLELYALLDELIKEQDARNREASSDIVSANNI